MKLRKIFVFVFILATPALAADPPLQYADAKAIWEKSSARKDYQQYSAEFAQFNNHFHLDEKGGCYGLPQGPVNLMLVITPPAGDQFSVIQQVLSDVDNAKSQCFKKTYDGIRTKAPPFFPFVLQMRMG